MSDCAGMIEGFVHSLLVCVLSFTYLLVVVFLDLCGWDALWDVVDGNHMEALRGGSFVDVCAPFVEERKNGRMDRWMLGKATVRFFCTCFCTWRELLMPRERVCEQATLGR